MNDEGMIKCNNCPILLFQIMGKKIRMKWKKLDIVPQDQEDIYEDKNISLDNQHPFMKVGL